MENLVADAIRQSPLPTVGAVVVAIPDITRPLDYAAVLAPLIRHLRGWDITVVVALGLHRKMRAAELRPIHLACPGVEVIQHDADDSAAIPSDSGALFHPKIHSADLLISVGVVEPHQYAGFSGGAKTFAIGCADRATISRMHGLEMLTQSTMSPGELEGNLFQAELWRNLLGMPPLWTLAWVSGEDPEVYWGPALLAFAKACDGSRRHHFSAQESAPWMHLHVPQSKSANFYQASRAATYVSLVSRPAIDPGGWILLEASCPEGIGRGSGEKACAAMMRRGPAALLADLQLKELPQTAGGAQRAYVLACALQRNPIALIGAPHIPELEPMGIPQFNTVEAARAALLLVGQGREIRDPFHGLPVLSEQRPIG